MPATGGGPGTIGGGSGATGGGTSSTTGGGGGGGGGGGTVDSIPDHAFMAGDAGTWRLTDRSYPGQLPYYFADVVGRSPTQLWVASPFGDVWFFNGSSSWTAAYDDNGGGDDFRDLATTAGGVVAAGGLGRLLICTGNCSAPNSFFGVDRRGYDFRHLCVDGERIYAVGRRSVGAESAILFRWESPAWTELPVPPEATMFSSCAALSDGSLLLSGNDLWKRSPSGEYVKETFRPEQSSSVITWNGLVGTDDGHLYATGSPSTIAERRSDGTWKQIFEITGADDGLYGGVPLSDGTILFYGGPPMPRVVLSGSTFTTFPDPVSFRVMGAWAPDMNHQWLAGSRIDDFRRTQVAVLIEATK